MTFNYIITIHNSASHLDYVLDGVMKMKSAGSRVYAVLDGCTDNSAAIVSRYPEIQAIVTGNIRETLAINAGLKAVPQDGYNLILQDDVILLDPDTEKKILELYRRFPDLGVVGFRHGCNLEPDALTNGKPASEADLIQNIWQPPLRNVPRMQEGYATFRQIVYKSPICISSDVVRKLGGYDERFAPVAHDDAEYCIRAHKAGLRNIVAALRLDQPIEWGGSRRNPGQPDFSKWHFEHMNLLRKLYPEEIASLSANHPHLDQMKVW